MALIAEPNNDKIVSFSAVNNFEFVFGGTFDPVHNGHIAIIEALQKLAPSINIRLVPCAIPALKAKPSSEFKHRIEMLQLAIQANQQILIDPLESERDGPSYTIETLASLKKDNPQKHFIWVMGADSLAELPRWHQWQKLHSMCHLLVLNRSKTPSHLLENVIKQAGFKLEDNFQNLLSRSSGMVFSLKMPEKAESSTQIRQNLRNNLELDSMLPQSVIKYITFHHLYSNDDPS